MRLGHVHHPTPATRLQATRGCAAEVPGGGHVGTMRCDRSAGFGLHLGAVALVHASLTQDGHRHRVVGLGQGTGDSPSHARDRAGDDGGMEIWHGGLSSGSFPAPRRE